MIITDIVMLGLIVIIFCISVYALAFERDNKFNGVTTEYMINIPRIDSNETKWSRSDSCKLYMDETTSKALTSSNVTKTDDKRKADIIFPCGYNDMDGEIKKFSDIHVHVT